MIDSKLMNTPIFRFSQNPGQNIKLLQELLSMYYIGRTLDRSQCHMKHQASNRKVWQENVRFWNNFENCPVKVFKACCQDFWKKMDM